MISLRKLEKKKSFFRSKLCDHSQRKLAELVGTTASVIYRLEDADYEGHSISMLNRIASALDRRIKIDFVKVVREH